MRILKGLLAVAVIGGLLFMVLVAYYATNESLKAGNEFDWRLRQGKELDERLHK